MTLATLAVLAGLVAVPPVAENPLAAALRKDGWTVGETRVSFPAPIVKDGASADEERAALKELAGSERAVSDLLRDSVTAPFIFKTSDLKTPDGVIRRIDLWFAVHADLDAIDPDKTTATGTEPQTTEAANMKFTARRLEGKDLDPLGPDGTKTPEGVRAWYIHVTGRLLDRLQVEATDQIIATRTEKGWDVATQTDHRFDKTESLANRWWPITRKGSTETQGEPTPFPGGVSLVSLRSLAGAPGVVWVEAHSAFFEPQKWFDGAPILRSKLGLVAQDRIRGLRRELARSKSQKGAERRSNSVPFAVAGSGGR